MIKKICLFLGLFLFFLFFNLIVSPITIDEIWVYGFTNNLYLGLVPYRDFNMIIPPLFYLLMSLPFHLFGSSMLVFHIENALLITLLFILIYRMIGNKIFILLPFFIFPFNSTFPNYNFLLLFFFILLLYLEKEQKFDFLIGIVLGLMILTKHTVGFFMIFPSLYYLKDKRKMILRICGCSIPCLLFLIYLFAYNTFDEFFDLGVLGLFDFAQNNQGLFHVGFFLFCIILGFIIFFIYRKKERLSFFYLLAFVSNAIPIFDIYHVWILLIAFLFIVLSLFSIKKQAYLFTISFFLISFIYSFQQCNFQLKYYPNSLNHFEYRYLSPTIIKHVEKYNEIIRKYDYQFFIVGAEGYFHKIILDQRATYLDLPCGGNHGYNGYQKMIQRIEKLNPDTLILVSKKEKMGEGQIYKELFLYIEENYELIDEDNLYYFYMFK